MLDLFSKAGAKVDVNEGRVRIPSELIDHSLAQAVKKFTIYGRDRSKVAAFGIDSRNYNSSAGQAHWIDRNGSRRFAALDDVVKASKLGQCLPRINIVGAMADPHEIDVSFRCVEVAAAQLRTTTKPITFWFHDQASARFIVELFAAVAGSVDNLRQFPFAYPLLEPISPLRFPKNGIELLFETSKVPLPVPIGPMAQTGLTAPGTLAGTLAMETAEILAGVCVTQLIRPGTPICFGGIPHIFDMRTTQCVFGGPEQGLMAVAMTEIGRHYGLSVYVNTGLTDSKCIDAQAGLEISATLLLGVLAGADIFGHLGIIGVDQGASLEMLVFQHEIIEYIERIVNSIIVDENRLGFDIIKDVGPGGAFIDQTHTVEYFRSELWMPKLLNRQYWPIWEEAGKPPIASILPDRVDESLAGYVECPLGDTISRDVDKVLSDARKYMRRH
jgi:trimethylamine--corrinoid protein Co-methyltransferase